MNLTVNLSDRTEIAAASALLAAILGGALEDGVTRIHPNDNPAVGHVPANETFRQPAALPDGVTPMMDAGAVFGGAAAQLPPGVPAAGAAGELAGLPLSNGSTLPAQSAQVPASMITPQAAALGLPQQGAGVDMSNWLDSDNLPWDERIHAGTKTKNADGRWKAKKGLNDAAKVEQIKNELRARLNVQQAGNVAQSLPAASPASALPTGAQPLPLAGALTLPVVSPDPTTFEALMQIVVPKVQAGLVPADALPRVCVAVGAGDAVGLQKRPDLIPTAWATLKQHFPAVAQ